MQQVSDGYILGGSTYSFWVGQSDALLIKTDTSGNAGYCGIVQNVVPTVNSITITPAICSPTVTTPVPTVTNTVPATTPISPTP